MQKLNIPLSRHTKTTRPLRQVVWLLGMVTLVLVFVSSRVGELWFSRDTIFEAAPEGTVLAIGIELTRASWPLWQKTLAGVPLISNRSLDIDDLATSANGELAIFLTTTGERAVAIRSKQSQLPQELLTSLSITQQEAVPGIILLSQTLLPISGITSSVHAPVFPSLQKHWLGRVEVPDMDLSGSIFGRDGQLELAFPNHPKNTWKKEILPQVMLAISTSKNDLSLPPSETFDVFEQILSRDWSIIVAGGADGSVELLLKADRGETTDDDLLNLLQLMGAYLSPTIKETNLKDGTSIKEILVDPSLVTVEQLQVEQIQALRVLGPSNQSVYGAFLDDQIVFSSNENLLLSLTSPSTPKTDCVGNTLSLSPSAILKEAKTNSYNPSLSILKSIFDDFSAISIEMNKYSSTTRFCST
ncbi:hypothetical protein HZA87_06305 [Candidatus Uhrbacteria bacterium]|nr:hypothetical protein [Candidatus Uhrbacteria bacterium]